MSKKSGFFYSLLGMLAGWFSSYDYNTENTNKARFQPPAQFAGKIGTVIRSHGVKPVYGRLPRKEFYRNIYDARKREHYADVQELAQKGITWTPFGLFWASHQLAVDHQ